MPNGTGVNIEPFPLIFLERWHFIAINDCCTKIHYVLKKKMFIAKAVPSRPDIRPWI